MSKQLKKDYRIMMAGKEKGYTPVTFWLVVACSLIFVVPLLGVAFIYFLISIFSHGLGKAIEECLEVVRKPGKTKINLKVFERLQRMS